MTKVYQWVKSIFTKKQKGFLPEERLPMAKVVPQVWTPCDRCEMCKPKAQHGCIDVCLRHTDGYGEQMSVYSIRGALEECSEFEAKS